MADQVFNVRSGFYDAINYDRLYSADDMNKPYSRVVADGVFATQYGTPSDDLQVVSAGDGMKISVLKGQGICGAKWFENDAAIIITVPSNTTIYKRIDSVLMQVDKTSSGRVGSIVYRTGEASATPVPPDINTAAGLVEYRLANLEISSNAVSITNSVITDLRGSSECPWVTGLITQVDTSTLWQQYAAAFQEYFAESTKDFEEYCDRQKESWEEFIGQLTEELTVTPNILTYTSTYSATGTVTNIPINIASFDPATDELLVYINGIYAPEGDRWSMNADNESIDLVSAITAGNVVNFVVLKSVVTGNLQSVEAMLEAMDKKIVNQNESVTPEMYGAVGNGVADDTAAWQAAVDSGHNVVATKAIYKCGQINVTKSITIDCGMATFISTGTHGGGVDFDQLFVCSGEVVTSFSESADYAAFTNIGRYSITNPDYADYTGYAFLRGTNLFSPPATDTFGGFIARFCGGNLCDSYPIDVENVTVDIVNAITVTIKNFGDIQRAAGDTYTRPIEIIYGANCILENINIHGIPAYSTIWLEKCYGCRIDKCSIVNNAPDVANSYPIMVVNSSFSTVTNSNIHNEHWHCWSTGGANPQYLCYANTIDNCVMMSPAHYAILDHENGRGTRVTNTICTAILLHGLGVVDNVTMHDVSTKYVYLDVCFEPTRLEGVYSISNVKFAIDPANTLATPARIRLYNANNDQNAAYYIHNLEIHNVIADRKLALIMAQVPSGAANLNVETVSISDTTASVYIYSDDLVLSSMIINISNHAMQTDANAVESGFQLKAQEIYMTNCLWKTGAIVGCTNCLMSNVRITSAPATFAVTYLVGSSIFANISDALLKAMSRVNVANIHRSASDDIYNIRKMYSAPVGLVYQRYELDNGAWVLNTIYVP
jgi:hypothetical protein